MNSFATPSAPVSPKSGLAAFILCFFFGAFGVHRFYVGKIGTGILMLITAGGLGLWALYDLVSIVCGNFWDSQDRVLQIAKSDTAAKKVVWVVGILGFAFFATVFMSTWLMFGKMTDTAQQELAALRVNNIEAAYSLTASDFKNNVPLADFKKFVHHYPELQSNVGVTFTDKEFHDNRGVLKGTLKLKDGKEAAINMELIKEGDQWKIYEIDLSNKPAE